MGKPFYDQTPQQQPQQSPTAPTLNEIARTETSYVDFIILGNKENYSVRADKLSILNSNTELAKMVRSERYTINHNNINVNNFEAMIRFIETKFIRFTDDIKCTLNMLELASMYQCHDLEVQCVRELDLKLNVDNVIDVYKALRYYNTSSNVTEAQPQRRKKNQELGNSEAYLNAMFYNTLQFIDQHAADVLVKPDMLTLRFEELEIIVKRDALQIPTEIILFELIAEWSSKECERKNLEPSEENRRRVLGGLIYTPRYLLMKSDEFKKCRGRVNLLDPIETQLIENFFAKKKNSNLTEEQMTMLENFKKARPEYAKLPIELSTRSAWKNYSKKMRKYAQRQSDESNKGCGDACLLNCVSVLACVFE
jgi:hypothetical protein